MDIAWAAGFYEGEGSVQRNNKTPGSPGVQIAQKDPAPLLWLRERFGGSVREYTRNSDGRAYYKWWLSGTRARGFLFTIFSLLSARRRGQIKECF